MTTIFPAVLPNSSVRRDVSLNNIKSSTTTTVPRVTSLLTTPAFPDGKIAYDLTTNRLYYSSNRVWIEAGTLDLIVVGEANGDVQVVEAPTDTYTVSVGKKENTGLGSENMTINGSAVLSSTATGSTAYGFLADVRKIVGFCQGIPYR